MKETDHDLSDLLRKRRFLRKMASNITGEKGINNLQARVILQQCLSARLQVQPASEESHAKFVEINRGLVVYICFLKDAEKMLVEKIVKAALNAKLSRNLEGRLVSILTLPGDLLIIPQATLGGKLKGKGMQYHTNVMKDLGEELYTTFVTQCKECFDNNQPTKEAGCTVKYGTYGNTQVLKLDTNGPYTHILEF